MALLALTAFTLSAQTKLDHAAEVPVVSIDAVVTDKAGHRVTGLTKSDFVVTDDGKPQTITNFQEVGVAAAPAPRRYLIFVDNDSLQPVVRKQCFAGLRKFVDAQLESGDQASVVIWNRSLEIAAPLTSDKNVLKAAIDAAEATQSPNSIRASYSRVLQHCQRNLDMVRNAAMRGDIAYRDCTNVVRQEVSHLLNESRQMMNAVNVAMTTAAGAEGKKVLILVGANLPEKPGYEVYRWANMTHMHVMRGFDWPNEQPSDGDVKMQREMVEKLARSANAHGVSLYPIDAPPVADAVGIQSKSGGDDFGADFLRMENTEAAFGTLAAMTGGMAIMRPPDFSAAIGSIAGDLDSYYAIGYQPPVTAGRDRVVAVRTKNRDYTVRARQTYALKTAEEQMSDRVIANIFSPTKSGWLVTLRAGAPQQQGEGGTFVVPVEVTVPPTLTLLSEEGKLTGGLTVYIAVGVKQGALSTMSRSPQAVVVPAAEEAAFRSMPITFGVNLTLKRGENLVSIAVVDQVSRAAGFARTTIITP
ncbi:MAG: VWA domain-containing protein [Acidobacteriota bacterium]